MTSSRSLTSGQPAQRRPRHRLLPLLVLVLVLVPIFEVWLLIQVGQLIGVWPTVLILVVEAAVGAWLLRREGSRAWRALNGAFATGRMPTTELTNAALVLVGGVLLMLPGFATDLVGFCCLLPFTRALARRLLQWLVLREVSGLTGAMLRDGAGPGFGGPGFGGPGLSGAGYGPGFGDRFSGETIPGQTIPGETIPGATIPGETVEGEPNSSRPPGGRGSTRRVRPLRHP